MHFLVAYSNEDSLGKNKDYTEGKETERVVPLKLALLLSLGLGPCKKSD